MPPHCRASLLRIAGLPFDQINAAGPGVGVDAALVAGADGAFDLLAGGIAIYRKACIDGPHAGFQVDRHIQVGGQGERDAARSSRSRWKPVNPFRRGDAETNQPAATATRIASVQQQAMASAAAAIIQALRFLDSILPCSQQVLQFGGAGLCGHMHPVEQKRRHRLVAAV
jgi:hypothetical protein